MGTAKKKSSSQPRLEVLEPRLLYSAEIVGGLLLDNTNPTTTDADTQTLIEVVTNGDDETTSSQFPATAEKTDSGSKTELVVVDGSHENLRSLFSILASNDTNENSIDYVSLDAGNDSQSLLQQLNEIVSGYDQLDVLHLVTHGDDGEVSFGSDQFGIEALKQNQALLAGWSEIFSDDGDILLYGCNVAETDEGKFFVNELARLTAADVAASTGDTGNHREGADWLFEYEAGEVEARSITETVAALDTRWEGVLDTTTALIHHFPLDGNTLDVVGPGAITLSNGANFSAGGYSDYGVQFGETTAPYRYAETGPTSLAGTGDFTIAFWMKPSQIQGNSFLIGNYDGTSGYYAMLDSTGAITFEGSDGTNSFTITSTTVVASDRWYLVFLHHSQAANEWLLSYIDDTGAHSMSGIPTTVPLGSTNAGASLFVGAQDPLVDDFDGVIDEIRIYNRNLDFTSRTDLFNLPVPASLNSAPVGPVGPFTINVVENDINSAGMAFSTIAGSVTDSDSGSSVYGYAIYDITTASTDGHWEYTTNGGSNWFDVGTVSVYSAVVIPEGGSTTKLRFVPEPGYTGTPGSLYLRALDDTYSGPLTMGSNIATFDGSENGGSTPVSQLSTEVSATVTASTNSAPSLSSVSLPPMQENIIDANGQAISTLFSSSFSDPEGDTLAGVAVTSDANSTGIGEWQYSLDGGDSWIILSGNTMSSALMLDSSTLIRFKAVANYEGPAPSLTVFGVDSSYTGTFTTSSPLAVVRNDLSLNGGTTPYSDVGALISVYINSVNTAPYFDSLPEPQTTILAGTPVSPRELASGDFDGDGNTDLVVIGASPAQVRVLWNEFGDGTVTRTSSLAVPLQPESVLVYDIDANGSLDILVTSYDTSGATPGLWIYSGDGAGAFIQTPVSDTAAGAMELAVIDANGDALPDLAVTYSLSGQIKIFEQTTPGVFGTATTINTGFYPQHVLVADINGDGDEDLLVNGVWEDTFKYYESGLIGGGAFTLAGQWYAETVEQPELGDLDGDGDIDVVYGSSRLGELVWMENDGSPTPSFTHHLLDTAQYAIDTITLHDVDGDGDLDILSGGKGNGEVYLYRNGGAAEFSRSPVYDPVAGGSVWDIDFADFNGDGVAEILVTDLFTKGVTAISTPNDSAILRLTVLEDYPIAVPNVVIADYDSASFDIDLILTVTNGAVELAGDNTGITVLSGGTAYSPSKSIQGSVAGINTALAGLNFLPATDFNGIAEIKIGLDDNGRSGAGGAKVANAMIGIEVLPNNDAPVIQNASLPAIVEDSSNTSGATVASLFVPGVTDADTGDVLTGVAIGDDLATVEGTWQYSTNGGTDWYAVGAVSYTSALVLEPSALLRFEPAANFSGTAPGLRVFALDYSYYSYGNGFTSGATRVDLNVTISGGSTAISALPATLDIPVTPVNDAPSILSATMGTLEDETNPGGIGLGFAFASGFADVDPGSSLSGIAISGDNTGAQGTWQYSTDNGTNWYDVNTVSLTNALVLDPSTLIRVVPAANVEGNFAGLELHALDDTYTGTFTNGPTRAVDDVSVFGGSTPISERVTLNGTIFAVNDAPVIPNRSIGTTAEDDSTPTEAVIGSLYAGVVTDPDTGSSFAGIAIVGNSATTEGQWEYRTSSMLAGTWLPVGSVSATNALILDTPESLRFVPAPDWNGTPPPLLVKAIDDTYAGSFSNAAGAAYADVSTNGGDTPFSDLDTGISVVVAPVNDPPVAVDVGYSTLEGVSFNGDASTGDYDIDDLVLNFSQVSNPANGSVSFNNSNGQFMYTHDGSDTTSDSFNYVVIDSAGAVDTGTVNITIVPVNDPPTVAFTNTVAQLPEDHPMGTSARIADIVVTDDPQGINDLTLAGTHAPFFEIVGTELHLRAGTVLDHELLPTMTVTIQVDDTAITATSPDDTDSLNLVITDVNEPPTVTLTNTVNQLPENQSTATSVKVADIVLTDDAIGTNQLTLAGMHASFFQVVGTELHLAAGVVLDYETFPNLSVTVQVDDTAITATSPDDTDSHTLQITDSNEPPTVALANPVSQLAESVSTLTSTKVADIVVSDDAIGSNQLSLAGPDAAWFQIVGNELHLAAGVSLDFETQPVLSVTVQVDDAGIPATNPDDSVLHTLLITDGNDAPGITLANAVNQLVENQSTLASIKVADIVVSDDAIGSNQLSLAGPDAAWFQIVGNELHLAAGVSLDFETQPVLSVTVQVDDASITATNPDDAVTHTLLITDINEPPAITLANPVNQLPENTSTLASIKVADIVISDDALGTNQLSLAGPDATWFQIVGNELHLAAGAALDFDTQPVLSVTVQVDDAGITATNPDDSVTHTLLITDINEPPAITLANPVNQLAENQPTLTSTKVADIVVSDDATGSNQLSLAGPDASWFQIVGNELHLTAGVALDYETQPLLSVTVQVDDATIATTNPDDAVTHTLMITDSNEPPTVTLANTLNQLPENQPTTSSTKIADIVVSDDAIGVNQLTLAGTHAASFQIIGTELHLAAGVALNADVMPTLDVTVQVDDTALTQSSPDDAVSHTVQLTDINSPPSLTLVNIVSQLSEDNSTVSAVKVADIVVTDDQTGSNLLSLAGADALNFQINGSSLFITPGAVLDYETQAQWQVDVLVDDPSIGGGAESLVNHSIAIIDANEAPTVSLVNVLPGLAEDTIVSQPIKVADIVISDDALGSNTLQLTGTDAASFEINGNSLYLSAGVVLDYESGVALDVSVAVDDAQIGTGADSIASYQLAITDINEPPGIALLNTLPALPDNTDTTLPVRIADIVVTDDALGVNQLGLSGPDATLFEIDGNGLYLKAGSVLDFNANPVLMVSVSVDDATLGTGADDDDSVALNISDTAVSPIVLGIETSQAVFTENQPAVALSDTVLAIAPGSDPINAATVRVVDGFTRGEDWLSADVGQLSEINGEPFNTYFDSTSGQLMVTGSGSAGDYINLLRAVTFHNTSEDPVAGPRTIEISLMAGGMPSNTVEREVMVVAQNDTPEVVVAPLTPVAISADTPQTINTGILRTVDVDNTPQEIAYTVTQAAPGIDIMLNGAEATSFTQADIDAGAVAFTHDGSADNGGELTLMIDDGLGGAVEISMQILLDEPELGAGNPGQNTIGTGGDPFGMPELNTGSVDSDDFINSNTTTTGDSDTDPVTDQAGSDTAADSEKPMLAPDTPANGNASTADATITDALELLVSLKLPQLPFAIEVFQQTPLVNELAEQLFDRTHDAQEIELQQNEYFASLLDLNPVSVAIDSTEWIKWQTENGGFERSLERLDEQFEEAAELIENEGAVSDLVVGTSLGLTTGFLIWLLRGGTLLASVMSVAPLWKQMDPLPILSTENNSDSVSDESSEVERLFETGK